MPLSHGGALPENDRRRRRVPPAETIEALLEERDVNVGLVRLSSRLDHFDEDYRDLRASLATQWKRMDELTTSITAKIEALGSSINDKIEQANKPQWQTYISGALLIGSIFYAFITPIQKAQEVQDHRIEETMREHRTFVTDVTNEFARRNSIFVTQKEHDDLKEVVRGFEARSRERDTASEAALSRLNDRLTDHIERDLRQEGVGRKASER